jgi:hypothetical protein
MFFSAFSIMLVIIILAHSYTELASASPHVVYQLRLTVALSGSCCHHPHFMSEPRYKEVK